MNLNELRTKLSEMEIDAKRYENLKISLGQIEIGLLKSREILEKEELDVEKLEGTSFKTIIETIFGRYDETLKKEQDEALQAKLRYDRIVNERIRILKVMDKLELRLSDYEEIKNKYQEILELAKLKYGNLDIYSEFNYKLKKLRSERKEINEAIEAGFKAQNALKLALVSLSEAKTLGNYDILGGGIFATMMKHSKMDEAKEKISNVQYYMKTLNRELSDIDEVIHVDLELGDFVKMADYFFDGLLVDLAVQSRIQNAYNKAECGKLKLIKLMNNLKKAKAENEENYDSIEKQFEEILTKAEFLN